jgi:hypothetical protein
MAVLVAINDCFGSGVAPMKEKRKEMLASVVSRFVFWLPAREGQSLLIKHSGGSI